MQDVRQRFGRLVAANRKRVGLTQDGLADAAGVSRDTVARIESGALGASFETVGKLAAALKVDFAELFTAELPQGGLRRGPLSDLIARLALLSDREIAWVSKVLDVMLKPH